MLQNSNKNKIQLQYENKPEKIQRVTERGQISLLEKDEYIVKNSVLIQIRNIDVYFPFKPYDIQEKLMQCVIDSLDQKLQSPTGTGKTLSLLCASLAWLQKNRQNAHQLHINLSNAEIPSLKIIYASRTHSQLKQVLRELKRTVWRPKISVLGSRDQLCINHEFSKIKGSLLNQACQKAITTHNSVAFQNNSGGQQCAFYQKENLIWLSGVHNRSIMDIEELRDFGNNHENHICPFYFERFRKENADLIFMPYNYLLDNKFNGIVDVSNSIIIFDEAHNVLNVAEEVRSFSISAKELQDQLSEIQKCIKIIESDNKIFNQLNRRLDIENSLSILNQTHQAINHLVMYLLQMKNDKKLVENQNEEKVYVMEGSQIFQLLFQNSSNIINDDNFSLFALIWTNLQAFMHEMYKSYIFEKWVEFIEQVHELYLKDSMFKNSDSPHWTNNSINGYKLIVQYFKNLDTIQLNMMCLDPGLAFHQLFEKKLQDNRQKHGAYNIILSSGTLTPFNQWESELRMPFQIKLQNDHILDSKQNLIAGILRYSPNGTPINFSYQKRENNEIYSELGKMLYNLVSTIPNGILVVFCSYSIMNKCRSEWYRLQFVTKLSQIKELIWEPRVSNEMNSIFDQYSLQAKTKKGAILFAVARGKVSEGIDFCDELCRAVFMIGIPYPPTKDTKIEQKRAHIDRIFFDKQLTQFQKINSTEWYRQQAIRATNQAIGRVIRHKDDWGAIYLCDARFDWKDNKKDLSSWIQPILQSWQQYNQVQEDSLQFFEQKNNKIHQSFENHNQLYQNTQIDLKEEIVINQYFKKKY